MTVHEEMNLRLIKIDFKIFIPIESFSVSFLREIINLKIDFREPKVSFLTDCHI